jgi:hypothetical protein
MFYFKSYLIRKVWAGRRRLQAVFAFAVCIQMSLPGGFGLAQSVPAVSQLLVPDAVVEKVPKLLLPRDRSRDSLNQLYEFDRSPLGNRIPVILVPGRAEEFQQNSWWKGFNLVSREDPAFRHQFKVYVFLYNSKEELDVQAQGLVKNLKIQFGKLPKSQPLMLVTYSLGGVISREVLRDKDILDQVDTMIAIAVPFHGSPLFDPDWFSEYLNPPNRSPIRRFWDRTVYRGYMFSKSNLTRGLRWDNFDGSKPQFRVSGRKSKGDSEIIGDQVNSTIQPFEDYENADEIRRRTIVYASFMVNGYTNTNNQSFSPLKLPKYVLENSLAFPKQLVATVLPLYGFTVHSVFNYMNHQLANIPTYTPEDPQGKNTHLYRFNDGAIPMSSMLFLPARQEPYAEDLPGLLKEATVRQSRIFVNLDHMHLGEYTLLKHQLKKPDMLRPEDGVRSPHQWIIMDLKRRLDEIRQAGQSL